MASKTFTALFGTGTLANEQLRFLAESAYLWSYRGDNDKAAAIFQAVNALAPNDPIPKLGLAEVYLTQKKFREAEKLTELATRSAGCDRRTLAFAYRLRGKALLQLNKYKDAEKAWKRAIEIDPDGEEGRSARQMTEAARKVGIFPSSSATR